DFPAHSLSFNLLSEREEDLICDVRERRSETSRRRKLRHQHGGLLDDRVDEQPGIHPLLWAPLISRPRRPMQVTGAPPSVTRRKTEDFRAVRPSEHDA